MHIILSRLAINQPRAAARLLVPTCFARPEVKALLHSVANWQVHEQHVTGIALVSPVAKHGRAEQVGKPAPAAAALWHL
jgi:hypothetical protein